MISIFVWLFFFFFQAEDGIRDISVTGVQTCALPIFIFAPSSGLQVPRGLSDFTSVQTAFELSDLRIQYDWRVARQVLRVLHGAVTNQCLLDLHHIFH